MHRSFRMRDVCFIIGLLKLCTSQHIFKPVFINESALIPRVVDGTPASLGEIPYQVALMGKVRDTRSRKPRYFYTTFCGGSIIAANKVLTSAHCFAGTDGGGGSTCSNTKVIEESELTNNLIVAGSVSSYWLTHREQEGQARKMQRVLYPSSYDFPTDDVAILIPKKPFIFNSNVNIIPIARKYQDYRGDCSVSGFGRTVKPPKREDTPVLLKANINVLPAYWCRKAIPYVNPGNFVCSSGHPGVSKGDSGGPMVCRNTGHPNEGPNGILVGISTGVDMRTNHDLFLRVSSYTQFIDENEATRHSSTLQYLIIFFVIKYFL